MKASNGRLSGDGSAQVHRHGWAFGSSYPQIFFVHPKFCCAQKIVFQHMIKTKIFPLKMCFARPNFKTWLRPGSAKICLQLGYFVLKAIRPRDVA